MEPAFAATLVIAFIGYATLGSIERSVPTEATLIGYETQVPAEGSEAPVVVLPPAPPAPPMYTVAPNDSLSKIAQIYALQTCELANANGITSELIHPGQTFVLPAPGTVAAECQLEKIYRPAPVSVIRVVTETNLTSGSALVAGQKMANSSGAAADICAGWTTASCGYILEVAQCESTDYYHNPATDGGYYVGAFQIDPELHAWRFYAHGWNPYTDGLEPYKNAVIASEIYRDSGLAPWPSCRYQ